MHPRCTATPWASGAVPVPVLTAAVLLLADAACFATADSTPGAQYGDADVPGNRPSDASFLYFAYGSNLLARRLHLLNPTARRHGIGKLQDYRLDFSSPSSPRWGGCPATVVHDVGDVVWGALWELDIQDRDHLDRQEGVSSGLYDVFNVTVLTPGGESLQCRCYRMRVVPPKLPAGQPLPLDRRPSFVYKQVMAVGARESGLPDDYVARIEAFPDNGSLGTHPPLALDSLRGPDAASDTTLAP